MGNLKEGNNADDAENLWFVHRIEHYNLINKLMTFSLLLNDFKQTICVALLFFSYSCFDCKKSAANVF